VPEPVTEPSRAWRRCWADTMPACQLGGDLLGVRWSFHTADRVAGGVVLHQRRSPRSLGTLFCRRPPRRRRTARVMSRRAALGGPGDGAGRCRTARRPGVPPWRLHAPARRRAAAGVRPRGCRKARCHLSSSGSTAARRGKGGWPRRRRPSERPAGRVAAPLGLKGRHSGQHCSRASGGAHQLEQAACSTLSTASSSRVVAGIGGGNERSTSTRVPKRLNHTWRNDHSPARRTASSSKVSTARASSWCGTPAGQLAEDVRRASASAS